jgi:parvulin-like peptidyl-prolyl isomerase
MEVFGRLMDVPSRDSAFTEFMSEYGGVTNDFKMLSDIDENTRMVLMGTSEHDVFGPLNMPDGIKYYRVDQRREGANPQVRASHILFDFGTNKDSARAVAENVLARARKGEDFGMLAMTNSKDVGSARQQGDLGYFGKGRMVAEFEKAAFDAQVGEIVGPVESQFGYHIIKVTDKQNTEIKYSEISIAPRISNITKQAMLANSAKMEERVTDGAQFDTVAKSYNLPVSESKFFSARTPVINSAELTAWAFAASKGDVTRVDVENMGMVIAQLVEVREKGLKPLEDMKEEILQTLRLNKKVDRLKAKAEQVAQACKAAGSIDAARSIDSTLEVRIQTGLLDNGQLTGFAGDFTVSHAAFTLPIGQVGNAVRGKRAWFVMVVDQRTVADMAAFKQNAPTHYQALSAKDRQNAFYTWYQNIRDNANIVDKRWDRNQ